VCQFVIGLTGILHRPRACRLDFSDSGSQSSDQPPVRATFFKPQNRACKSLTMELSDSGSQSSDQQPATKLLMSSNTNDEVESSGSSSSWHDVGRRYLSFQAVANSRDVAGSRDTRVLIASTHAHIHHQTPSPPRSSNTPRRQPPTPTKYPPKSPTKSPTKSPRKPPRSTTTTPRKALHRDQRPVPSGPKTSLCDPICFGFFSPHKAPKTRKEFPKCLSVVLRDSSALDCHPGQAKWRKQKLKNAIEQAELFQDLQDAIVGGSVVLVESPATLESGIDKHLQINKS